jgi:hypothetical protein
MTALGVICSNCSVQCPSQGLRMVRMETTCSSHASKHIYDKCNLPTELRLFVQCTHLVNFS